MSSSDPLQTQNALTFDQLRERLHLLERQHELSQEIAMLRQRTVDALKYSSLRLTAEMDLRTMLESILTLVFDLLAVENAHVFLYDGDRLSFGAVLRSGKTADEPFHEPRRDGLTYQVARSGERIIIEDMSTHPLYLDPVTNKSAWSGSIMGVPLKVNDIVVGVMNLGFKEARVFQQHELDAVELFALQAAIAIENARLYRHSQANAQEMRRLREQDRAYFEELNRTKDLVMQMATHDLKNPINIIKGFTDLLEKHGTLDDDKGKRYLSQIRYGTQQMVALVSDLLDLARLETGLALTLAPVSLNSLMDEAVGDFELPAQEKSITLALQLPEHEQEITVDRQRIHQVFSNLISNAIKYTPAGGRVSIKGRVQEGSAIIQVVDTGLGIPDDALPQLFDKFYRVQTREHLEEVGTGLGLAIVKTIVEQHCGKITVTSEVGTGSTFTIDLPLRPPDSLPSA